MHEAADLGIAPVVGFDFDAMKLAGRFDVVFDTTGTLPIKAARTLLKPGGRVLGIVPTPAKLVRSVLPGPFQLMVGRSVLEDPDAVAQAVAKGRMRVPVAPLNPRADGLVVPPISLKPAGLDRNRPRPL
jgi:NADPH:quinone reductase-like Zn-dependent oxidoreductase